MTRKQRVLAIAALLLVAVAAPVAGAVYDFATGGCCGSPEPVSTDGIFLGGFVSFVCVLGVVLVWQRPPTDGTPRPGRQ